MIETRSASASYIISMFAKIPLSKPNPCIVVAAICRSALHGWRKMGGIVEREQPACREHDRSPPRRNRGDAAMHIALDGDLLALQHPGDQPLGADGGAGIALKHALERLEELIETVPMRQERGQLGRRVYPLCADREERLHRLEEQGEAQVVGSWRVAGDVDQGERRNRLRHVLGLVPPAPDICAGKAEPRRGRGREGPAFARRRRRAPSPG